jgi:hypothetical protein
MENDEISTGRSLTRREALGIVGAAGIVLASGCGGGSSTVASTASTGTTSTGTTSTKQPRRVSS